MTYLTLPDTRAAYHLDQIITLDRMRCQCDDVRYREALQEIIISHQRALASLKREPLTKGE